jgi:hypothetical protein
MRIVEKFGFDYLFSAIEKNNKTPKHNSGTPTFDLEL